MNIKTSVLTTALASLLTVAALVSQGVMPTPESDRLGGSNGSFSSYQRALALGQLFMYESGHYAEVEAELAALTPTPDGSLHASFEGAR